MTPLERQYARNSRTLWQTIGRWWIKNYNLCMVSCAYCGSDWPFPFVGDVWDFARHVAKLHRFGCPCVHLDIAIAGSLDLSPNHARLHPHAADSA